jgi:hypothetical protein
METTRNDRPGRITRWGRSAAFALALTAIGVGFVYAYGTPAASSTRTTSAASAALDAAGLGLGLGTEEQTLDHGGLGRGPGGPGLGLGGRGHGGLGRLAERLVHSETIFLNDDDELVTRSADHGTVTAVTDTSITIDRADGQSVTIAMDEDTEAYEGREELDLADVEVGADVIVVATQQADEAAATADVVKVIPADEDEGEDDDEDEADEDEEDASPASQG